MKMLVEKLVDGKQDFEVVDADCASQAINQCSLNFLIRERDNVDQKNEEVAYVAVYEIGQTNLLEHTNVRKIQAYSITISTQYTKIVEIKKLP
ncbi:hypothetical protein ACR76M_12480 [Enterococcus innesii]|uniref:hypothetical protein n=1 Tax=Enterococcus innesii TaxID=2839759 RepID=UPI003DA53252